MKYLLYIIAFCSLLFTQACKKKLEGVPYKITTNEVILSLDAASYSVIVNDTLKIKPIITETLVEGHSFTYSWQVWPNLGGGTIQEISKEKELKAKIILAPVDYRLRFVAKDEVTGISYFSRPVFLTVSTSYAEGWLVTHNSGGKGHLGFIRTDDVVFLTPMEDINKKTYPEGIAATYNAYPFNSFQQIIYITKTGAYRVDPQSFVELNDNSTLFFDGGSKLFGPGAYTNADITFSRQVIINNGEVYATNAESIFNGMNGKEKFSSRLDGDYTAFPFLFQFGPLAFYDNKSMRFLNISSTLKVGEFASGTGLANIGKRMIAADIGPSGEAFCVLFDDITKKFHLFSVSANGTFTTTTNTNQEMLNCPDLGSATSFTMSGQVKTLYYAAGNKIYLYDIGGTRSAKLIYTFPAGNNIADLKMFKENGSSFTSYPEFNNRLVVGVNNGSQGDVYYLALNTVGEVIGNTYSSKFPGFGQIVHLNFRTPD